MSAITPAAGAGGRTSSAALHPNHRNDPSRTGARLDVRRVLGPDFGLTLAFLGALAALVALFGASFVWKQGPILIAAGILASLIGIALVRRVPALVRGEPGAWRDFPRPPVAWPRLGSVYHHHVGVREHGDVHGRDPQDGIHTALYRMDLRLFGVEPTVWVGRLSHPLLTDWMSLTYGLYFILPMLVASAFRSVADGMTCTSCRRR